jgi:membrane-associated protease RseP (regulator of RpoE activity)
MNDDKPNPIGFSPLDAHSAPIFVMAELVPEPPRQEILIRRPRQRRVWLPLALFVATCLSTLAAGGGGKEVEIALRDSGLAAALWVWLIEGLKYAVPVMTILICHEMGHFLQARRYGVYASYPYFLPLPPPLSPTGTLGAVIAMEARMGHRRALFDIGITGPLAGLVPTMIFSVIGLRWSHAVLVVPGAHGLQLGDSVLFRLLTGWICDPLPAGHEILLHPMAFAGWVGLLVTSLNLIPIGQLDGGHILYALLRQKARPVATLLLAAALGMVIWQWKALYGWSLMLFLLLLMGPIHPPTANDDEPLGTFRIILGWLTLAFIPIGFTPQPLVDQEPPPVQQRPAPERPVTFSIPQRLDGGGNAAAEVDEGVAGARVADLHHRRAAEQAAEVDDVAGLGPRHRNQAYGRGLVVDHADGRLVGD